MSRQQLRNPHVYTCNKSSDGTPIGASSRITREHNYSIHPRVVDGRTRHPKENTSYPKGKLSEKKIKNMEAHIERHPRDAAAIKDLANRRAA